MRKWISCFLALVLLISLSLPALAAESEAQEAAQTLYELGLFKGTGTDAAGKPVFDLNRAPTRAAGRTGGTHRSSPPASGTTRRFPRPNGLF